MTAPAGFREALWARLAALFRQGADFFESKSQRLKALKSADVRHDQGAEATLPASRLKGAPTHWLAMVRERAPGFLHRLESVSYQAAPAPFNSANSGRREMRASSDRMPGRKTEPSTSEPALRITRPGVQNERHPTVKPECFEPDDGFCRGDGKRRPQFKQAGWSPQQVDKAQENPGFKAAERTDVISGVRYQAALSFESNRPAAIGASPQARSERLEIAAISPIAVSKGGLAEINKVSAESAPTIEASIIRRPLPTVEPHPAKELRAPGQMSERSPEPARHGLSDQKSLLRPDRNHAGKSTGWHGRSADTGRSDQRRYPATDRNNVPAQDFWPDSSGLEKNTSNSDRWPELPEDVWSELWHDFVEPAGAALGPADTNCTEDSWNG